MTTLVAMRLRVLYSASAVEHLDAMRAYDRTRVMDEIDEHLAVETLTETPRRKILAGASPSFEHVPPVWQLRVGDFRVFFDLDQEEQTVTIRAVLHKGSRTTGEIL